MDFSHYLEDEVESYVEDWVIMFEISDHQM